MTSPPVQAPHEPPVETDLREKVGELEGATASLAERAEELRARIQALGADTGQLDSQQGEIMGVLSAIDGILDTLEAEVAKRVRGFRLGEFDVTWPAGVQTGSRALPVPVPGAIPGEPIWAFPIQVPDSFLLGQARCAIANQVRLNVYCPLLTTATTIRVLIIALR